MRDDEIVPGVIIDSAGEATISKEMGDVLFELALEMEEPAGLPVDVEHVLAAMLMAVRSGELNPRQTLAGSDRQLVLMLLPHVKALFRDFGGVVGKDD